MKKILIISYLFPPFGGIGVQRVLKFVKYLPLFGWQPTVLTPQKPDCTMLDRDLLKDVPSQAKIIRTRTIEFARILRFVMSVVDRVIAFISKRKPGGAASFDGNLKTRFRSQINDFIFIPDNRIGWIPFAFLNILRSNERDRFDVIFSTSPPFSTHLVGLIAKFVLRKPWVVDFRDLWILDPYKKPLTKVHRMISKYLEHKILKLANRVLTVSEPLKQDLKKSHPDIASEKFEVIPNGYDAADFEGHDEQSDGKFSIGHVGSLHWFSGRTPYYFLKALADLRYKAPEYLKEMRVFFVGATDALNKEINAAMITKWDLQNTVCFIDFVPHNQAIKFMKRFNVLVFIPARSYEDCGSSRGNISGKLYEYFAAGKPILALTNEGFIKDFVSKSGCGIVVDYDDIREITKQILNCFVRFKQRQLQTKSNWEFITRFERKRLTGQLAAVLNKLSESTDAREVPTSPVT